MDYQVWTIYEDYSIEFLVVNLRNRTIVATFFKYFEAVNMCKDLNEFNSMTRGEAV